MFETVVCEMAAICPGGDGLWNRPQESPSSPGLGLYTHNKTDTAISIIWFTQQFQHHFDKSS